MASYDYYYGYGNMGQTGAGVAGFLAGFFLVFYLLLLAFSVVTYILQSLGMYTIAKRRGIHHPWLAWVPIGNMWLLGSIADQYQYVAKGKIRNRRKTLLGLTIAIIALMIPMYASYISMIVSAVMGYGGTEMLLGTTVSIALISAFAMVVVAIIACVFLYIALYELYASCDPNNAVMYIVLSIFINVTMPFFVFLCRKKDLGMPAGGPPQPVQPVLQAVIEEAPAPEEASEGSEA